MNTVRKSPDGNIMIVQRPSGYAVSTRAPHWNPGDSIRIIGVQTLEWATVAKGLDLSAATAMFDKLAA
jgi:hypothetical protein